MTTAVPPPPRDVTVVEVGPRDGLQNELVAVTHELRLAFVRALAAAGLARIEAGAFVRPDRVPQMAGSDDVCRALIGGAPPLNDDVRLCALVPNMQGFERAAAAGLQEVAIFAAATEAFSRRNLNASVDETLRAYADVCAAARARGMRVRGYVSVAFGCPYEGKVAMSDVLRVSGALLAMGAYEVAVSDTIGVAHPAQVRSMLRELASALPLERVALHFHDTRGTALANVLAALDLGIRTFDASAGGLGGCPFAPGATGNLATEDLLYMLHGLGLATRIDLDAVVAASAAIEAAVGRPLPSRYYRAAQASRR